MYTPYIGWPNIHHKGDRLLGVRSMAFFAAAHKQMVEGQRKFDGSERTSIVRKRYVQIAAMNQNKRRCEFL